MASVLWGGTFFLYVNGQLPFLKAAEDADSAAVAAAEAPDPAAAEDGKGKRKRSIKRPRLSAPGQKRSGGGGEQQVGDDIDWDGPRNVDMGAGEGQLTGAQIEAGFDSMMGRIRRCLILVPADGEITGKLLFGMRIGSDGRAKAVNLTGPSMVTGGESGSCLRQAAQSIQFAKFDGPDMLFKYPITLQ